MISLKSNFKKQRTQAKKRGKEELFRKGCSLESRSTRRLKGKNMQRGFWVREEKKKILLTRQKGEGGSKSTGLTEPPELAVGKMCAEPAKEVSKRGHISGQSHWVGGGKGQHGCGPEYISKGGPE